MLVYSVNELDGGLWRAYFRMHAQYCTRCDICLVSAAADAMPRNQDVSSDEEDDDDSEFDPVVVSRTSAEGRMMSKWLTAARKKLGGSFPRPDARAQVEQYAQRLRDYKFKKAKKLGLQNLKPGSTTAAPIPSTTISPRNADLYTAATKALAIRWVRLAKNNVENKRRNRAHVVLGDLEKILDEMGAENDWYYTGALRLEGEDLYKEGKQLQENRSVLESEATLKISKIENERNKVIHDLEVEIENEKKIYELKVTQHKKDADDEMDKRMKEIEATRDAKKAEFDEQQKQAEVKFGFVPPDMIQSHTKRLVDYDEQIKLEKIKMLRKHENEVRENQAVYDKLQNFRKNEIERKKAQATEKTNSIQNELSLRIRGNESEWQINTLKWNTIARKKVESKLNEDEAKGSQAAKKSTKSRR